MPDPDKSHQRYLSEIKPLSSFDFNQQLGTEPPLLCIYWELLTYSKCSLIDDAFCSLSIFKDAEGASSPSLLKQEFLGKHGPAGTYLMPGDISVVTGCGGVGTATNISCEEFGDAAKKEPREQNKFSSCR